MPKPDMFSKKTAFVVGIFPNKRRRSGKLNALAGEVRRY
jgi:hypothetical protein